MNAIVKPEPTTMPMAFNDMERLADAIAKSNLFGLKTREQALVLMMISHAEGRHPALAARDYDVIANRPAKKAEAMLRDFLQAGGRVEWHTLSDEIADATFSHPQGGSVRITWDMKRANVAGLGSKDTWKKFPRQMLRSRAVSEGVRTVYPLATSGLYVPEEVADFNGTTLEAEPDERSVINDAVPLKPATAATSRAERKVDPTVYDAGTETDEDKWLRNLATKLAMAQSQAEVIAIADLKSVKNAVAATDLPEVQSRVTELLHDAYKRFAERDGDDLDDVEIVGADKIAAG